MLESVTDFEAMLFLHTWKGFCGYSAGQQLFKDGGKGKNKSRTSVLTLSSHPVVYSTNM